ncbi:hypothetical protein CFIMG_002217RA [Ceratocystis fimbriata CBS 114723]|uniref:DUF8035 domain-containing protein n=1 Tax=Ceratocystis fimbriata CBS 114723 TaxID=1035309 RepID=A0A2C5X0S7_9PEZI|nr:hypothetical protein CFIMG_002217RA [Ceratocystis fimbriata CBS 114723]
MALAMDIPMSTTRMIAALDNSDVLALALFHRVQALSSATASSTPPTYLSSFSRIITGLHTVLASLRTEAVDEHSPVYSTDTAIQLDGILRACTIALGYLNNNFEKLNTSWDARLGLEESISDYVSQIEKYETILHNILDDVQDRRAAKRLITAPIRATDELPQKDNPAQDVQHAQNEQDETALSEVRRHIGRIALKFLERGDSSLESVGDDLWSKIRAQLFKDGLPSQVVDKNSVSLRSFFQPVQRSFDPHSTITSSPNIGLSTYTPPSSPLPSTTKTRRASISYSSPSLYTEESYLFLEDVPLSSSPTTVSSSLVSQPLSTITTMKSHTRALPMRDSRRSITTADVEYITTEDLTRLASRSTPSSISKSIASLSLQDRRASHSGRSSTVPVGPDQFGSPIAPAALWTKVSREKFTAEAFRRSKKHFEAFPSFIAILGFIGDEELQRLSDLSNEIRQSRMLYAIPSHKAVIRNEKGRSSKENARSEQRGYHGEHQHKRDYAYAEEIRPRRKEHDSKSYGDRDTSYHDKRSQPRPISSKQSRNRTSSMSLVMPGPRSRDSISRPKPTIVSPPISSSGITGPNMTLTLKNGSTSRSPTRPKSILKNANPHDVVYDSYSNPSEVPSSWPRQSHVPHLEAAIRASRNSSTQNSDCGSHTSSNSERERRRQSRRSGSERGSSSDASRERYNYGSGKPKDNLRSNKPRNEFYAVALDNDANTPPSARRNSTMVTQHDEPRRSSVARREGRDSISSEPRRSSKERGERSRQRDSRDYSSAQRHPEHDGRDHRKERRPSLLSALKDVLY